LTKGQKVLVYGATGAIGTAAVQLLKYHGMYVVAVGNTKNMELVKSLGADKVIDYQTEDFTQIDDRFKFVFDAVGKSSFGKCKPLLNKGGIYISSELGWMWENLFFALTTPIFGNKKVIFPIPSDQKESLILIKKMMEEGKFQAVIDRKYSLEKIPEAFRYVLTEQKTGNVTMMNSNQINILVNSVQPKDEHAAQAILDYIASFAHLTEVEKQAILDSVTFKTFKKGEFILMEGEILNFCYFIIKGCVREYYIKDGEEKITNFYIEQDPISSMTGNITKTPSKYFLECLEDTIVSSSTVEQEEAMFEKL